MQQEDGGGGSYLQEGQDLVKVGLVGSVRAIKLELHTKCGEHGEEEKPLKDLDEGILEL